MAERPPLPKRSKIRQWLRMGPSKAEIRAELDLIKFRMLCSNTQRNEAQARAKAAEAAVRAMQRDLHGQLNEDHRTDGGCSKVRFHYEQGAGEWAATIAERTGEPVDVYNVFDCKVCPRSPVTYRRYWHVGHSGTAEAQASKEASKQRRRDADRESARQGNQLRQRIDPRVLDKLRKIRDVADAPPS